MSPFQRRPEVDRPWRRRSRQRRRFIGAIDCSRLTDTPLDHYAIRLAAGFYDAAAAQTLFIARSGDDVILFYAPPFSWQHSARPAGGLLVDAGGRHASRWRGGVQPIPDMT